MTADHRDNGDMRKRGETITAFGDTTEFRGVREVGQLES
jgi:hypothetical protein